MSKATAVITDRFNDTFVRTKGTDTTDLQKAFFMMGFRNAPMPMPGKREVYGTANSTYIRVEDGVLFRSQSMDTPEEIGITAKEVSYESVLEAAEEVRKIKRAESKAQKKRAAKRKWDATATKNTFNVCPVSGNVVVAYKMRDGEIDTDKAGNLFWGACGGGTIMSYKVLTPNKHKPKLETMRVVSVDEMFSAIAASMGKDVEMQVKSLSSLGGPVGTISSGPLASTAGSFTVDKDGATFSGNMLSVADTNPKKQYGVASIPLEMWPDLASAYGALGLYNGALKYGKANFANTPVEASIYIAAAKRHLAAWCAGEEFDPADGVPNLGGVLANIAILLEARAMGTLIDDRMLMSGYLKERETLKGHVKPLQVLHADKNPKHYIKDNQA